MGTNALVEGFVPAVCSFFGAVFILGSAFSKSQLTLTMRSGVRILRLIAPQGLGMGSPVDGITASVVLASSHEMTSFPD